MFVKLPPGDLNPDPNPPHLTSIYTYEVTTAPRVRGGLITFLNNIILYSYIQITLI